MLEDIRDVSQTHPNVNRREAHYKMRDRIRQIQSEFLVEDSDKYKPVTTCMDVYKAKIQSDVILDKIRLRILVRVDLHNKELVVDTWSPTASMRTLKYFLVDATKHKARVHQLDFIGSLLQAKVKNRVFVKLDSRYEDYFPKYAQYLGRALRLLNSMNVINNSGKLFADE